MFHCRAPNGKPNLVSALLAFPALSAWGKSCSRSSSHATVSLVPSDGVHIVVGRLGCKITEYGFSLAPLPRYRAADRMCTGCEARAPCELA